MTALHIHAEADRLKVVVSGPIDRAVSSELEARVNQALDGGCDHVVIDLRHVSSLSMAGLNALLSIHARACAAMARLELLATQHEVALLLHRTGLGPSHEIKRDRSARGAKDRS